MSQEEATALFMASFQNDTLSFLPYSILAICQEPGGLGEGHLEGTKFGSGFVQVLATSKQQSRDMTFMV